MALDVLQAAIGMDDQSYTTANQWSTNFIFYPPEFLQEEIRRDHWRILCIDVILQNSCFQWLGTS